MALARKSHQAPAPSARRSRARDKMLRMRMPVDLPHIDAGLALFDFAPVAHVLLDSTGIVVDIDASGCTMLGTDRRRIVGRAFSRWIVDDEWDEFLEHLRRCRLDERGVESR